jgi:purine-cytosine permease-like protein
VNAVIDVHGQRLEAFEARVPYTVPLLLVVVAAVALGTVGYGYGVCRGRHRGASVLLATLVAAILYVILDLDEPRRGPVQVSQESLRHLKATLDAAPPNE